MKKAKLTIGRVVLLALALLVLQFCLFSNVLFTILGTAEPFMVNDELHFDISYGTTVGLLDLTITDTVTGKTIWDMRMAYYYGDTIKYGEVPLSFETAHGAINNADQTFPIGSKPAELREQRTYKLYTDWQYDVPPVSACVESKVEYFRIENGEAVFVKAPK